MNDNIQVYRPENNVRVVTATSLFDGHDAAINIMRRILQATGVEVIHLGHNRSVQEIVDAAVELFIQNGFHKTTTRQIAKAAGFSIGSLYEYVASKEDILYLVCDAIQPTMTHLVPLASAIIERRGGMLIHGAIIAREYGLPCVTGVPDATTVIADGDRLTVDGFLGIVTVSRE